MKIIDFFKDRVVFLAANLIIFLIVIAVMIAFNISLVIIFVMGCLWFIPLLSYIIQEVMKLG